MEKLLLRGSPTDEFAETGKSPLWPKVVVFGRDATQTEQLVTYMASHALQGVLANSASAIKDAHLTAQFDAIVLGIGVEDEDPLDLIRDFTGLKAAPGLIVYSTINNEVDRVVALELGADDVVPKSCGYRELVARIKAVLRRRRADPAYVAKPITSAVVESFEYGGWLMDLPTKKITTPQGRTVLLSRLEFMIMSALFQKPAVVHSRAELARLIGHADKGEALRAINVLVGSIRKKITADGGMNIIVNRRGVGYHLSELDVAL
jgi:two-component system OmpR family response regulator